LVTLYYFKIEARNERAGLLQPPQVKKLKETIRSQEQVIQRLESLLEAAVREGRRPAASKTENDENDENDAASKTESKTAMVRNLTSS